MVDVGSEYWLEVEYNIDSLPLSIAVLVTGIIVVSRCQTLVASPSSPARYRLQYEHAGWRRGSGNVRLELCCSSSRGESVYLTLVALPVRELKYCKR